MGVVMDRNDVKDWLKVVASELLFVERRRRRGHAVRC